LVRRGCRGANFGTIGERDRDVLKGKRKPTYSPDVGDHVIVINAQKRVTDGSRQQTLLPPLLYPGGHSLTRFRDHRRSAGGDRSPAVKRMLPRNRLGRAMMKKLKIYAGTDHPHVAQAPRPFPWSGGKLMTGGE
jgi:large subunit ribosomal protein L13